MSMAKSKFSNIHKLPFTKEKKAYIFVTILTKYIFILS